MSLLSGGGRWVGVQRLVTEGLVPEKKFESVLNREPVKLFESSFIFMTIDIAVSH